jgi:hypothetical protein
MAAAGHRATVAIGPVTDQFEAYHWVGSDMAPILGRYFDVVRFDSRNELPKCDAALIVKGRVPHGNLKLWRRRGVKILYLPVDRYRTAAAVEGDWLPDVCAAVVIHCERLRPYLERKCPNVWSLDHYNKMGLSHPVPFRRDGFILWVGRYHYAPYILKWSEGRRLPLPLTILTNHVDPFPSTLRNTRRLAQQLGVSLSIRNGRLNGHVLYNWSREVQEKLLSEAKAAIDIKGGPENFHQFTKPPTKGQKYVMSGLPFGVNPESYTFEYFQRLGFDLAAPTDTDRWFSEEYHRTTNEWGARLREELSLEQVGQRLRGYIEAVLASRL